MIACHSPFFFLVIVPATCRLFIFRETCKHAMITKQKDQNCHKKGSIQLEDVGIYQAHSVDVH